MQELADRVLLSKSGLTRLIDRMERDGLVDRSPCPDDRRGTFAKMTDDGLRALRAHGARPTCAGSASTSPTCSTTTRPTASRPRSDGSRTVSDR